MRRAVKTLNDPFFALSQRLNEIYAEDFRVSLNGDEYVQEFKQPDGSSFSFRKAVFTENGFKCLLKVTTVNGTRISNAFQFGDNSCEMYELRGSDPMEVRKHFGEIEDESLYPLKIVDVLEHKSQPRFWHYVSFGLSDLFDDGDWIVWKKRDRPIKTQSGNIELSLRVPIDANLPPTWPARALQLVAQEYFNTGLELRPNQCIELNEPIAPNFNLIGFVIVKDELIGTVPCSQGGLEPLLLIGVTANELEWASENSVQGLLNRLGHNNEMLLTCADR